ncbi:extracellular solute-binding protein [Paenibacillus sp. P36]|uniref:extracellular solute-binding protein n=1 Tax=Paenibacillus sp. P36 TaxID=3342538 RepID=UPI0038B27187
MRRKGFAKLAGTALVIAMVTGCSSQSNPGSAATDKTAVSSKPAEAVTLKMMTSNHPTWPYNKNWQVYKYLKEKSNVTLDVETPPNDYETAISLAVSSGDMPDFLVVPSTQVANKYGNQGALVNIWDYLKKMPNYEAFLNSNPDVKQSVMSADGKSYFFPMAGLEKRSRISWVYRDDVFKKNNLTPPTSYDELYETAKKLKALYPSSYPIAFFDKLSSITNIASNFGTMNTQYYDFDKKEWRFGPIEDSYKEMIGYINKFYSEGLIPPDFMAMTQKQYVDLFAQNKAFLAANYIGNVDEIPAQVKSVVPELSLSFMAPPKGGANGVQKNPFSAYLPNGFAIASTTKHLDETLKYIDFLYSPEGIQTASWGKENETFNFVNGQKQLKPDYKSLTDLRIQSGIATVGSYTVLDVNAYWPLDSSNLQEGYKQLGNFETKSQPRIAFTDKELEVISTVGQSVNKYRDEQISKFILGQKKMTEWNDYVAEMNKLGVQKVLDVYKAAYDRALSFQK